MPGIGTFVKDTVGLCHIVVVKCYSRGFKIECLFDYGENEFLKRLARSRMKEEAVLNVKPITQLKPTEDCTRSSLRQKMKKNSPKVQSTQVVTGNTSTVIQAGMDSLLANSPYAQYTDNEIVKMFEINGFSLGTDDKVRLDVVNHFRLLSRNKLASFLSGALAKLNNIDQNQTIDLSKEVFNNING